MEFSDVSKRALEIRNKLNAANKPWGPIEHMQGFVGDIGDLIKLVMAKQGFRHYEDLDGKLQHELADCLYSVIVIADELGIDLEKGFFRTMEEIEERTKIDTRSNKAQ